MPIDKIIVVEDDAILRRNLEQQLRQQRYDVAAAGTLAGVRELMERDTFDLIFLDVRLPDGEGPELLRELQSHPQKPLVVMVTGFGSVESAVECMRNGAFDYMLKPFSSDQLQVTLKKAENFNQLLKVNAVFQQRGGGEPATSCWAKSQDLEQLAAIDPQSRPHAGDRADRRGERHRQGTGGAGAPPRKPAGQRPVHQGQLRRRAGEPD